MDAILEAMAAPSSPTTMIQLRVLGGAMADVAADETAFAHRDAGVMALIITTYDDPATEPAQVAWTEALHEALAPNAVGVYSNFLEAEGADRVRDAYPAATYDRLADVKRRYDPSNLFRLNQNIRPAAPADRQPERHSPVRLAGRGFRCRQPAFGLAAAFAFGTFGGRVVPKSTARPTHSRIASSSVTTSSGSTV